MNQNESSPKKSIHDRVLEAVASGRLKMRPRWQFIAQAAFALVGGVLLALASIYLVSFIIFALRRSGLWFIPAFGPRGWAIFLFSLPWALILLSIVFLIILEVLVRRYEFAYRRPFLYSVFGIFILIFAGGFMVAGTPLHRSLFDSAERHRLPFAEGLYHQFGTEQVHNIFPGQVTFVTPPGFILRSRHGEDLNIVIASSTQLPFERDFDAGDLVIVLGERTSSTVEALGIRKISE